MPIDFDALQTVSADDLLKAVNLAIAEIALYGQVRSVREKSIQAASLEELRTLRDRLQAEANAAGGRARNYIKRVRE